jgi:hypothetical protein
MKDTARELIYAILSAIILAGCAVTHCQTITNADLGKKLTPMLTPAQAAAILIPGQYVAPPTCTRCDGPYIATTGAKAPTAGPWDWPTQTLSRRLDGTPIYMPVQTYGTPLYWHPQVFIHRR